MRLHHKISWDRNVCFPWKTSVWDACFQKGAGPSVMCHYKAIAVVNLAAISADSAWPGQCFGYEQATCMQTCLLFDWKGKLVCNMLYFLRPFEWQIGRNGLKCCNNSKASVSWQPSSWTSRRLLQRPSPTWRNGSSWQIFLLVHWPCCETASFQIFYCEDSRACCFILMSFNMISVLKIWKRCCNFSDCSKYGAPWEDLMHAFGNSWSKT